MKALILAAGLGTRLLPYTEKLPKPLFTLMSRPVLDHAIQNLIRHGCREIVINTHHLHDQIETFVRQEAYGADIQLLYEPLILDTGGAIANARQFLKDDCFFVINSDIVSSVDLDRVFSFHKESDALATLVLHEDKRFNKIALDDQGYIRNFNAGPDGLAFTGIQVLDPRIFDYFPDRPVFSSIEVYQDLCPQNRVKGLVEKDIFWSDMGTPQDYSHTSLVLLAGSALGITPDPIQSNPKERIRLTQNWSRRIQICKLAGDGSDRNWFRAESESRTVIGSDHGICLPETDGSAQMNAFIRIGNHLYSKGIPVPRLINHDRISGMVILEDLGDVHLETLVKQENNPTTTLEWYQRVIDHLIDFSVRGAQGFELQWTCQTQTYSKELILQKECRYFMEAFVQGVCSLNIDFHALEDEFETIADQALEHAFTGLMHRDMQSRNIMIHKGRIFFIDFQSARIGPLEYDLASLMIDPYVNLDTGIQKTLLNYAVQQLNLGPEECEHFTCCYQYCRLTRNLQILGAFGFLSRIKNKKIFERYIPDALASLKNTIKELPGKQLPKLNKLVQSL